jgi:hypothetical protein
MSDEDITQTTLYVRAVEAVAEAARRVEEVRVKYENTMDALMREKREADEELRAALSHVMDLTGKSLPVSEREKDQQAKARFIKDTLAELRQAD